MVGQVKTVVMGQITEHCMLEKYKYSMSLCCIDNPLRLFQAGPRWLVEEPQHLRLLASVCLMCLCLLINDASFVSRSKSELSEQRCKHGVRILKMLHS